MGGLLSFRKHQDNQGKKYNSVPEVTLLQPSKPAVLCCAVLNDVGDMSASLSGQQLLGGLGQMLAVPCGCVKYSGEGCQECTHKNDGGGHRERMAEMA